MFKNLGDMMKQAQQLQTRLEDMKAELQNEEHQGLAGGGLVSVTLNGAGEMCGLTIDPSLIRAEGQEVFQDLIVAAHNDAHSKMKEALAAKSQEVMGGLPLPPGMTLPFG